MMKRRLKERPHTPRIKIRKHFIGQDVLHVCGMTFTRTEVYNIMLPAPYRRIHHICQSDKNTGHDHIEHTGARKIPAKYDKRQSGTYYQERIR